MPFVPLRDWYLSAETALYSCGLYIITSMIVVFMPEWWYGVDYAIQQCVYVLMCVQGVAVLERRLREYGMRRGLRGPMMAVAVAMFQAAGRAYRSSQCAVWFAWRDFKVAARQVCRRRRRRFL